MIRLLTSIFGGGLLDRLADAYKARSDAQTERDRIAAEVEIARLQHRLATSDNPGLRIAIAVIGLSMAGHLALVAFVSAVPQIGWTVHALPPPMNEWQAQIVLSLFGLSAVNRIFR